MVGELIFAYQIRRVAWPATIEFAKKTIAAWTPEKVQDYLTVGNLAATLRRNFPLHLPADGNTCSLEPCMDAFEARLKDWLNKRDADSWL